MGKVEWPKLVCPSKKKTALVIIIIIIVVIIIQTKND